MKSGPLMQNLKFTGYCQALSALETKAGDCRNRPRECQGKCCDAASFKRSRIIEDAVK
jgi:hypothetical protein